MSWGLHYDAAFCVCFSVLKFFLPCYYSCYLQCFLTPFLLLKSILKRRELFGNCSDNISPFCNLYHNAVFFPVYISKSNQSFIKVFFIVYRRDCITGLIGEIIVSFTQLSIKFVNYSIIIVVIENASIICHLLP
jgi:hypothetical protein